MTNAIRLMLLGLWVLSMAGCGDSTWNAPYPDADAGTNTYYNSFEERPKHLDPARSYSSNENVFLAQIYEPPLQYHFLLKPYRLVPLSAAEVPVPRYFDASGNPLPEDAPAAEIDRSDYLIRIQPGIRFQPHPAFAQDADGRYRYHALAESDLAGINRLADFPETGTRELTAEDFVYQIKRLAAPWLHSPIVGRHAAAHPGFRRTDRSPHEKRSEG